MNEKTVLLWSPRILGIAMGLFLGRFALDAFAPGIPLARAFVDFAIHLLPTAVVLAIVLVSWRRPWIAGVAFVLLATVYAVIVRFRFDWVVAISGPLMAVGLLNFLSWRVSVTRQRAETTK